MLEFPPSVEGKPTELSFSAMIFVLVETAKANGLNVYEYLKHLLTEIPKHMKDTNLSFVDALLPGSEPIQNKYKL